MKILSITLFFYANFILAENFNLAPISKSDVRKVYFERLQIINRTSTSHFNSRFNNLLLSAKEGSWNAKVLLAKALNSIKDPNQQKEVIDLLILPPEEDENNTDYMLCLAENLNLINDIDKLKNAINKILYYSQNISFFPEKIDLTLGKGG